MKKLSVLYVVLIVLTVSSCSSYDYLPSQQNVLLFTKKNDTHFSFGFSPQTTTGTIGHAFSDNVGFVSSVKFLESFETFDVNNFIFDNELVLYKRYPSRIMFAANVGYGIGQYGKYDIYNSYFMTELSRIFIQPSFGFSLKCFDFAVSCRVSYANFDVRSQEKRYVTQQYDYGWGFEPDTETANGYSFFVEPAITVGTGYDWLKFRMQPSVLLNIYDEAGGVYYLEDPSVNFSVHVTHNF